MGYITYILISETSGRLYIGQTGNLVERLGQHNNGRNKSTKGRGPWKLLYQINNRNRGAAMAIEKKLKSFKNRNRVLEWIKQDSVFRP